MVDEIAPKLTTRTSGHLRIVKKDNRRGDNAQMATVSFVDDIAEKPTTVVASAPKKVAKATEKKPATATKTSKSPTALKKTVATHTNKTAARAKGVTKGDR